MVAVVVVHRHQMASLFDHFTYPVRVGKKASTSAEMAGRSLVFLHIRAFYIYETSGFPS
jgi:hypothetical protein